MVLSAGRYLDAVKLVHKPGWLSQWAANIYLYSSNNKHLQYNETYNRTGRWDQNTEHCPKENHSNTIQTQVKLEEQA